MPNLSRPTALFAVFRNEWRQLVYAARTMVFMVGMLLALTLSVFLTGRLYDSDFAALDLVWTFLPWVALAFVPAFAMGAFASAGRDRELELMLSLPLRSCDIVVGKWLAGSSLLMLTLAMTAPMPLTIAFLGAPDWGQVASGYFGAALLLTGSFAAALLAGTLTRDPTSAYVLGVGLLLVPMLLVSDALPRGLRFEGGQRLLDALSLLSPKSWLDRTAAGRIETGTAVGYVVWTGLALWGAAWLIERRRDSGGQRRDTARIGLIATGLVAAGVALVALSQSILPAFDLTAAGEFSTALQTIAVARELPPGTSVDVYWSARETAVPARIRAHALRVTSLLEDIARRSQGRLEVRIHDVEAESDEEWRALDAGVRRVAMSSGDSFMLGCVLRQGERQRVIDYFDPDRQPLLEYDLMLAMGRLGAAKVPRVGLLSPLLTPSNVNEPREGLSLIDDLKRSADVAIVPFFAQSLPDDLDALIVIGGALMQPDMLYAIDQLVMRGKGLIVLLDPMNRFNPASDKNAPRETDGLNTIVDLMARYGARFDPDAVVGDLDLAAPVVGNGAQQPASYPFWLRVKRANLSPGSAATAGLKDILLAESGAVTLAAGSNAQPLLWSSARSGTLSRDSLRSEPDTAPSRLQIDGRVRTLAAFLPGPLASGYGSAPAGRAAHVAHSPDAAAVFLVADIDWLFDPLSVEGAGSPGTRPLNDNQAFLQGMVGLASGDRRLLTIRPRPKFDRSFTRVAAMLRGAQEEYRSRDTSLVSQIAKVERKIGEIMRTAHVSRLKDMPGELRGQVESIRARLIPYRQELRALRHTMRAGVEGLGRTIAMANILSGPLLTGLFALGVRAARRRRVRD